MHHYVTLWKLPIPIGLSAICSTLRIKTVLTSKTSFTKLSELLRGWKVYFAKRKNGLAGPGGSNCTPLLTYISHLASLCQNYVWQDIYYSTIPFSKLQTLYIVRYKMLLSSQ